MNRWILVANRVSARIFEFQGPGKGLLLVEEIAHPEGRLRNRDQLSDRPGRAHDRKGAGRHSMEQEETPHERDAANFARQLADVLDDGRMKSRFQEVVLIAEPRFLGLLRESVKGPTENKVYATIPKDLAALKESEILEHLGDVLAV